MQKKPTIIVVAAALIGEDGHVLLQQRSAGRRMAGLWEFPGGKLESGETAESALVRELEEELGIVVAAADLVPAAFASDSLEEGPLLLLLFACRRWRGEPRPLDAAALRWERPAAMRDLEMPPADRPLVDQLELLLDRRAQTPASGAQPDR